MVEQKKNKTVVRGTDSQERPRVRRMKLYCNLFYLVMYTNPWVLK